MSTPQLERLRDDSHRLRLYSVVMEPAHYAGLLRVGRGVPQAAAPRFDPNYSRLGEVMVRDLSRRRAASPAVHCDSRA
jgi:hypothetical protein